MSTRTNAFKEAFGYETQAINYNAQGEMAQSAANFEANTTLLTGGLKALGYGLQSASYFSKEDTGTKKEDSSSKPTNNDPFFGMKDDGEAGWMPRPAPGEYEGGYYSGGANAQEIIRRMQASGRGLGSEYESKPYYSLGWK